MSYSIKPILYHYEDARGLHAIILQVCHNRVKVYPETEARVRADQWRNGAVINHVHKDKLNHLINKKKVEVEGLLLEALKTKDSFTKEELKLVIYGKAKTQGVRFDEFAMSYKLEMQHKLSEGRLRHYEVIKNKVLEFEPVTFIDKINGAWLQRFENFLRTKKIVTGKENKLIKTAQPSTISTNIKIIKAIVRAAEAKGLTEVNFKGYKNPKIIASEPDFLTENELQSFFNVARAINKPAYKLAGYYFLLSCFTGLRLGDAKRFNYSTHVIEDEIIVRAQKNGKKVTIPLYTDLSEILDYIHDKPFLLSEQKARQYVKEIASLAGIKKHVKYHSSRHTATSRFLRKGLSLTEVAEIIGDTEEVTKAYYTHIDQEDLRKKVKELFR